MTPRYAHGAKRIMNATVRLPVPS